MRKAIITLISLCLFSHAAPAGAEVFSNIDRGSTMLTDETIPLPPFNSALVLRQRAVTIEWNTVLSDLNSGLGFNLFDDVTLEVVCQSFSSTPDGDRVCYGTIADDETAQVTMVVGQTRLAATIVMAEMTYKVRPVDDNWHLVREIRSDAQEPTLWAAVATDDERRVWTLTNQERNEDGLPSLSLNEELTEAARAHSLDMATQNYFSHDSEDGRSPSARVSAAGYERYTGENIAAGYGSPEAVVVGWMNSPGHRANILSTSHCDLGVGHAYNGSSRYGTYWTQDFGRQPGVSECPAVSDDGGGGSDGGDDGDGGDSNGGDGGDSGGGNDSESSTSSSGSNGGGCFLRVAGSFR